MSNVRYKYNDGGRSKYFRDLLTDDCVVRSIAIATKRPYIVVWNQLMDISKRKGMLLTEQEVYLEYLASIGWKCIVIVPRVNVNSTVFKKINQPIILHLDQHFTVMINNTLHDNHDWRRTTRSNKYRKVLRYFIKA